MASRGPTIQRAFSSPRRRWLLQDGLNLTGRKLARAILIKFLEGRPAVQVGKIPWLCRSLSMAMELFFCNSSDNHYGIKWFQFLVYQQKLPGQAQQPSQLVFRQPTAKSCQIPMSLPQNLKWLGDFSQTHVTSGALHDLLRWIRINMSDKPWRAYVFLRVRATLFRMRTLWL